MKKSSPLIVAVSLLVAAGSVAAASDSATNSTSNQVKSYSQLSSSTAFALANSAVSQCAKANYSVTATVVDLSGRVKAQLRNDNAGPHTLDSSRKKAFTAVSMKQPTANVMKTVAEKPILEPLKDMDDNLLFLAGGIPIKVNNQLVGAIGVGGAPGGHLDVACAEEAIKTVLK